MHLINKKKGKVQRATAYYVKMNLPKKKVHWATALSRGACLVTEFGTKTTQEPFCVRNKEVPLVQG